MEKSPSDEPESSDPRAADPIDIHVGTRVRLRRISLGLSQELLGGKVGLTFQQIQKYEKGVNRISASRLYQFSNALGVPIQFFYDEMPQAIAKEGEGPSELEQDGTRLSEFLRSKEGIEASMALSKISDKDVRRALVVLVELLGREKP